MGEQETENGLNRPHTLISFSILRFLATSGMRRRHLRHNGTIVMVVIDRRFVPFPLRLSIMAGSSESDATQVGTTNGADFFTPAYLEERRRALKEACANLDEAFQRLRQAH